MKSPVPQRFRGFSYIIFVPLKVLLSDRSPEHDRLYWRSGKETMKHYQKAITLLIAVVLCALCALPACAEAPEYKSSEEMGGATVGLLTGMPFESMITEKIPDIGGFAYFASMPDETLALKAHKIDAIFINNALIDFAAAHNPELVKMSEHYLDSSFGFAFPKGDP